MRRLTCTFCFVYEKKRIFPSDVTYFDSKAYRYSLPKPCCSNKVISAVSNMQISIIILLHCTYKVFFLRKNNNNLTHIVIFFLKHCTYMSLVVRKPVFGVSNQVRHKPGCTTTEEMARGLKFRIYEVEELLFFYYYFYSV